MTPFSDWNHKWFGWWKEDDSQNSLYPSIADFVDHDWQVESRQLVAHYLDAAPALIVSPSLPICVIGGPSCSSDSRLTISYEFHTDGVWFWPKHLSHYVIYT